MIDIQELLGIALKVEGTGYSFYNKLAERTEGEKKELFNRLAEQEREHGEIFRKILGKIESDEKSNRFDDEVAGYLKSLAEVSVFSDNNVDNPPDNLDEAVHIAINVEKDSIVFYSELIDYIPEKSALERVINEEKKHLRDLLNEFKR
ncbi:MAG: ferritin family protein [Kosmotogaceae bacterium]